MTRKKYTFVEIQVGKKGSCSLRQYFNIRVTNIYTEFSMYKNRNRSQGGKKAQYDLQCSKTVFQERKNNSEISS